LALRLEKFVKGSFGTIFNQRSSIHLNNRLTVFSFKNLEDQLRSIAIFVIVDYIGSAIKRDFRRRILIVDEAWYLMKNPVSAEFLWGFAKRARKYYLGLTTITQDIEDFLATDLGKSIITNSSIQILMKQSPAAIDRLAEVFYLSEGEKSLLLSAGIGEGLFFAGSSHVAMRVIASPEEHELITTRPAETAAPPP
jgi:type IV secretory pathway VirB4 component